MKSFHTWSGRTLSKGADWTVGGGIRKMMAIVLMMVLCASSMWAQSGSTPSAWDGTVATAFASGSGTAADPYIISNAAQLAYFGSQMNGKTYYVKLAADIDLDNHEWTYGKNSASNFKGHFDGDGHTISNLSIVPVSAKNNGFFSSLEGTATSRAEVKNLIIDGVTISQTGNLANTTTTGALAGNVTQYTDITNVTVKNASITFDNLTNTNYVGGFVGRVEKNNSTITDCSVENPSIEVTGNISGGVSYIGGAIGDVIGSNNLITTINGLTISSPSVTIGKVSVANCYIGAVFGRINTYSAVDDVTVSQPELLYKNSANTTVAINLGSFAGGIFGIANPSVETAVTNVTVTSAKLTLGTENNSYVMQNVNAGLIGQASTNVRLEEWTVDNNVQVNTRFANAGSTNRRIGGFVGYLAGASAAPLTVKDITINSSTINVKANLEAATYIGGFAGIATTNAFITNCTSKNSTVTIEKDMTTGASYIGGVIGDFIGGAGNISSIDGLNVENPSVTVDKVSVKDCCIGGVFGHIGNYTVVNNADAVSPVVTYNNSNESNVILNIGSYAGYIIGIAQQETVVSGVDITGTAQLNIGTTNQEAKNIRAGAIGYITINVRMEDCSIENTSVQVNGSLTSTTSYIGGFAGYMANATNAPLTINGVRITGNSTVRVTGNITVASYLAGVAGYIITASNVANQPINISDVSLNGTASVLVDGDVKQACYLGGFAGNMQARAYAANTIQADQIELNNVAITVSGQTTTAECYYGGMAGRVNTNCTLTDWSVLTSANITIGGNITTTCNIGGAFGRVEGTTNYPSVVTGVNVQGLDIAIGSYLTTTIYVGGIAGQLTALAGLPNKIEKAQASGKISITGSHTFLQGNKTYAFGGIVGYMGQTATTFSEVNQCVSEVNFDLSGLTPATAGNLYQNGLVVGGVIGRINTPSRLPESLYYSGKINAPFAVAGPLVGVFCTNIGNAAYVYDDYSGENASNVANEWAKADTWFYNGYKIGLSQDLLNETVRTKNYTGSPTVEDGVSYLLVGDLSTTFTEKNKIGTTDKNSYTILAYTVNNSNVDKGIYPQWTTNNTTYPAYYMYYMQGVNRGTYTSTPAETKAAILAGTLTIMTLVDDRADLTIVANRGFVSHTLTATASASVSIDSYKWYVNGTQQSETTNTFAYTPDISVNTVAVEAITGGKVVKRLECKVMPVFRVRDAAAAVGTKTNPYLLGSADELQLLSYLSTLPGGVTWEKDYDSYTHYNKAYYKMDGDVDLSAIDDFAPIGLNKAAYSQNYIFDGVFDGDRHTISGLKETWYGGIWGTDDYNVGWGLFAYVGNPNATVKVGDGSSSNAAIKNLIIDGATLTHDPNNTSFYYNSGTSGKTNNCMVGVLAGVVTSNTTIQNIEIRNSKITDERSSNYNLAARGLFVGGAIGSVQNAFNATANSATNTKIDHIAAQVDITLEHPTFADATAAGQLGLFDIGGIIGRYCATSATQDQAQANMPAYTFYSGSINASKAWISPVLGALRYVGQYSVTWPYYSKQWEGNNNSDATQLTITNAQYYNFRINGTLMTELRPATACARGARPVVEHTDATETADTYNAQKYQGVNYAARFIDSDGTTLYYMNQENTDCYWVWDSGFPHMTDREPTDAYLTRDMNDFTANMVTGSGSSYRWQVSYDGETWTDEDGLTQQTSSIASSARRKLVVAIITVGGSDYRTQAELVEAEELHFRPYITQTGDDASGYTLTIVWNGEEPSGILSATYQWYHSDMTHEFDGETDETLNLTNTQLGDETDGMVWCAVTIREMGEEVVTIFIKNTANVVYVNGNGYTGSDSNGAYGAGNDVNDGRTPQTPVKTIDKANSLLDGGPWDKNIIVVMGKLNNNAVFASNGQNPATLTGKWDGTDYEGIIHIQKTSGEDQVNPINPENGTPGFHCYVLGDTKFEHLTFEGNKEDNAFIECHGHDVTFGKGLIMTNFRRLSKGHGNFDGAQVVPELTIILTATNLPEADIAKYTNRTKPQVITFQSGHYGRIMGGRYTNSFFANSENTSHSILGSAEHPIWAVVNIDIDPDNSNKGVVTRNDDGKPQVTDGYTCDINCIIAGLTDGSMYGDCIINVHGGQIEYIVGGNQGNPVPNKLGYSGRYNMPDGTISGNWGQWPNATYFGRTVINVEQKEGCKPIDIQNLYTGGLGRDANGNSATSVVDMFFYGRTQVNMKSGTVSGNVYAGGAGGVIGVNPWDVHLPYATAAADNAAAAIQNGVQYGDSRVGTWSSKTAGTDVLATVSLHQLDDNKEGFAVDGAGNHITESMNLGESSTTLNISGGEVGENVYGGGCGFVSNMPYQVCMQGVGSIFGTSNVNISGGTIVGSVYGGSQGDTKYYNQTNKYGQTITHVAEMNGTVNLTISGTESQYPTIGGDIYGAGKGVVSTATEDYLRIATTGDTELGAACTTSVNILIDLPESHPFGGSVYGGGQMGMVDGNTNVTIRRGVIGGDVFGGSKGEPGHAEKGQLNGRPKVKLMPESGSVTVKGSVYGGGNAAKVSGDPLVTLQGVTDGGEAQQVKVENHVFGGGLGETAVVNGSTRVHVVDNVRVEKNVYGGGNGGVVTGNTKVVIGESTVEE